MATEYRSIFSFSGSSAFHHRKPRDSSHLLSADGCPNMEASCFGGLLVAGSSDDLIQLSGFRIVKSILRNSFRILFKIARVLGFRIRISGFQRITDYRGWIPDSKPRIMVSGGNNFLDGGLLVLGREPSHSVWVCTKRSPRKQALFFWFSLATESEWGS